MVTLHTLLAATSLLLAAPPAQERTATYHLRVDQPAPLRIAIRAVLPASSRLSMSDYGAWSQERGWAQFVQGMEVRNAEGGLLEATWDGSAWRLPASDGRPLSLSYAVDLSHVDWPTWPDGPRTTSAFRAADGAFVLLGALLVGPGGDTGAELVFEGEDWGRLAVPFPTSAPGIFRVDSLRDGARNVVAFQLAQLRRVRVRDLRLQIAVLSEASRTDHLPALMRSALEDFAALFDTPLEGELLAVVYPDAWDTGEAYRSSFVLATTRPLADETVAVWGQSIAHEVFHRWLGREIRGESWADSNWFSEGMTDYAASVFLVRRGHVGVDVFLDQLEKRAAFHRLYHKGPPFAGLSLVAAGADKGPNNAAVYDGGWLAAFALDVALQERTRGSVGFEDFLRSLLEYTRAVEGGYEVEDLEQLLDELSGSEFGPFFDRHIRGSEPLELVELSARAGFDLVLGALQAHARLAPDASLSARRIRERILAGPFGPRAAALSPRVDTLFASFEGTDRPGASVALWADGRLLHSRGYGAADLERGHPNRPDTVFHAASVSKQFTAFLVHQLEAEGALRTDDELVAWFPELAASCDGILVRHLLDHTSGLRDQWQLLGLAGVRTDDGDVVTQEDVLRMLFRQRGLSFAPGTQQAYCNSGYTLLAELVHRASGVPFPRLARERIFEPLGMENTCFQDDTTRIVHGRALGYKARSGRFEAAPLSFGTYGATGLLTTTEDLMKWGRDFWEHRVGTPVVFERMLERGRLADGSEVNFTSGLQVRTWRGERVVGHPGADAGFRSAVLVLPEREVAVALLGNADSVDMWGLPDRVLDLYLAPSVENEPAMEESDENEDSVQPRSEAVETDLASYVGTYYSPEVDTSYELRIEDGVLMADHVRNGAIPLRIEDPDHLRCDRWYLSELEIERDAEGRITGFLAHASRSRGVRFGRL